jgi:hypothetical protein
VIPGGLTSDIVIVQFVSIGMEIFPHTGDERIGDILLAQESTEDYAVSAWQPCCYTSGDLQLRQPKTKIARSSFLSNRLSFLG